MMTASGGKDPTTSFLSGYRALDLTDEKGYMCGKLLGALGVDVVKIEPPGGDPGRYIGPFIRGAPRPEHSLYWLAFNANKKSITLNVKKSEGRSIFLKLARSCDFILESFAPSTLAEIGLGYDSIRRINPGLIMTSISPYGQTGPHRDFQESDMILWAGTGYMWLCGSADRPPLRISVPQAYLHGGAEAAMGTMVAFWHRQISGRGQHVDVSICESGMWQCLSAYASWDMNRTLLCREGNYRAFGPFRIRFLYPCKNGHVIFLLLGGHIGARGQKALAAWMEREGRSNDFLRSFHWEKFDASTYTDELARKLEPLFLDFFRTKTKEELFLAALEMGFLLAPVNTIPDLIVNPHLAERGYFTSGQHPAAESRIQYPGAAVKSTGAFWRSEMRPPKIGEHNDEIFGMEVGLSRREIEELTDKEVI
jgi:crotonobetainyl-CoA:carnitine CoA-transferase CaiB-like acyl-CoA transferase